MRRLRWAWLLLLHAGMAGAAGIALEGVVLDTPGNPIPGADVWINQDRQPQKFTTDAEGAFRCDSLRVGRIEVVARKDGFALGGVDANIVGPAMVNIILREPEPTRLRVIDKQGNMVEGARIKTMFVADSFHVSVEDLVPLGFPSHRSDSKGHLTIPDLPKQSYLSLVLEHRDFADFHLVTFPVGKELDLPMARGRTVRGRVLSSDRAPLPRARVSLFRIGAGGKREFAEVVTDPEGYFAATVEPGDYYIAAKHSEHASPPPEPVMVKPSGDEPSGEIIMLPPRFVAGIVQDKRRTPQPGVEVAFVIDQMIVAQTWSQLDGSFEMLIPPIGGRVRVAPPSGYYCDQLVAVELKETKSATISPIILKELPLITGQIRDTDDKPLPNALITSLNLPETIRVITDDQGRFEVALDRVPLEEEVRFRVQHPFRFREKEFEVDISKDKELRIKLATTEPDLAEGEPPIFGNSLDHLVGDPAPEFECDAWFNSDPLSVAGLKGKVVVLTLWGGFPTDELVPERIQEMVLLHQLFKDTPDVAFVGIHDSGKEPEEIRPMLEQAGVAFPVGRDVPEALTLDAYSIMFIPQTVLIDKKGIVRHYRVDGRLLDLIKDLRRK